MAQRQPAEATDTVRTRPCLAAVDGVLVLPRTHQHLSPADGPETMLEVEFEGLTEAQQRAALAGFPGGRRFVLRPAS